MKYQEKYILKYDGSIEEYLKARAASQKNPAIIINYHNRINKLAIQLATKFPSCKNVNFVEVMKIAVELLQKRKSDEVVIDIANLSNEDYSGTFELLEYLKGIKSKAIVSKEIAIKYLEPIASNSKKIKQKKLVIDANYLVRSIELLLANTLDAGEFKKERPHKVTKLNLYGKYIIRDDQFVNQYSKVACREISTFLKAYQIEDSLLKDITIHALESVNLIERYRFYVLRKHVEGISINDVVDIEKRGLWVSRTYRSILR